LLASVSRSAWAEQRPRGSVLSRFCYDGVMHSIRPSDLDDEMVVIVRIVYLVSSHTIFDNAMISAHVASCSCEPSLREALMMSSNLLSFEEIYCPLTQIVCTNVLSLKLYT